jgi:hypothetical protein
MISERQQFGDVQRMQTETVQARPLLTLEAVADLLGVSKAWVRDHATRRNPRIPVVRFGDKRAVLRFRHEDVQRFINSHLLCSTEVR